MTARLCVPRCFKRGLSRSFAIIFIRHWAVVCFVLCCIIIQRPDNLSALTIDADQQYQFAAELFNRHQYRRAAEEYQRFDFFFPQDSRRRPALFKAGQAFILAKDPAAALELFRVLTAGDQLDAIAVDSYFMMVTCDLQLNRPTQAALELNNLIVLSDDDAIRDRAYYRLGWLFIDQTDWAAARKAFSRISESQRSHLRIDALEQELDRTSSLPSRSPALAGTLSIVPGAGQLYCNRYEDALIAFGVNLGLFWAAHDAFDQDQYALGGVLAFVGLGFYSANIYGAISDAHKFNQTQKRLFGESLQRQMVFGSRPGEPGLPAGIFFSLHLPF
jgi:tetratricopeptide (TPR) repeat protein